MSMTKLSQEKSEEINNNRRAVQGVPVNMVVGVEPKHGDEIPTITQQDMMVYQGHDRQPVTNWVPAKGNRAGLALAILIDDSAGLSLGTQINDIRTFIGQRAPTTLIAVGYMHNGTVALAQNSTQEVAGSSPVAPPNPHAGFATASRFGRRAERISSHFTDALVKKRRIPSLTGASNHNRVLRDGPENHFRHAGSRRDSALAVHRLHVCHDPGSAEHAVLRLYAL